MTTTLDLRGDYARLNPPKDLPLLEFDLMCGLVLSRPREEVVVMERRMGVRG